MWSFKFDEELRQWEITNGEEAYHLEDKHEAVELCGRLNTYELRDLFTEH